MKGGESEELREQIYPKGGGEGQSSWGRTNMATSDLAWDCLPGSSVRQMGKLCYQNARPGPGKALPGVLWESQSPVSQAPSSLSSSLPLGVPRFRELPAPKVTGTHLQSLGTLVIITTAGEEHSWILPNSGSQVLK